MAFATDSFTDTAGTSLVNHTGELGTTWVGIGGRSNAAHVISNANRVRYDLSVGEGRLGCSGAPATAEYDVECDIVSKGTLASDETMGVVARGHATDNTAYQALYRTGSGTPRWELWRAVAGSYSMLGSYTQALTVDQAYALKLECRDATKKLYVDIVERISSADNTITAAGYPGVNTYRNANGSDTAGVHMDNFSASDPAGAGGAAGMPNLRTLVGVGV